jgi:hypothetical protein
MTNGLVLQIKETNQFVRKCELIYGSVKFDTTSDIHSADIFQFSAGESEIRKLFDVELNFIPVKSKLVEIMGRLTRS